MCGHLFHRNCIDELITKKASCPFCEYRLKKDDMKKEMAANEKKKLNDNKDSNKDL